MRISILAAIVTLTSASAAHAVTYTETRLPYPDGLRVFGYDTAIDGTTAISLGANDTDSYAYVYDTKTNKQIGEPIQSNEMRFGTVAISGNTAIFGDSYAIVDGINTGAAYVQDLITRTQTATLTPSDGVGGDPFGELFGGDVAIDGNIAIIGAAFSNASSFRGGAAYVFDVSTGEELFKFAPQDLTENARFGSDVALSGNTALISAPRYDGAEGAAYLYDVTTGEQIAKLTSSAPKQLTTLEKVISKETSLWSAREEFRLPAQARMASFIYSMRPPGKSLPP